MSSYKHHFPVFDHHPNLVYLDTAATCQIPQSVHDVVNETMRTSYANMHRGVYDLAYEAEKRVHAARHDVANFLGAQPEEIIFTSGATQGLNLIARTLVKNHHLGPGSEVIIGISEHHANIIPWQQLAEEIGIQIIWLPVGDGGTYEVTTLQSLITEKTKVVTLQHVSNVTGAVHPIKEISSLCGDGIHFIVDGCQAVGHMSVDVPALGADFYVGSGHKMYGYPGVGILYGKKELLKSLTPAHGGGGSINMVTVDGYTPAGLPHKWEPGTQNIAGIVSLTPAITFLKAYLTDKGAQKEKQHMVTSLQSHLCNLPGVTVYGDMGGSTDSDIGNEAISPIISFTLENTHINDIADLCAEANICVRAGHMCCQPYMESLGIPGVIRISLGAYTTPSDMEKLLRILES